MVNGQVLVILIEGALEMTINGVVYVLDHPGDYFSISADGVVSGPAPWNSTVINAGVSLPLFGWTFNTDLPDNGLPDNFNGIDQLNGIILRDLTPPVTTPPPVECDGYCYNHGG